MRCAECGAEMAEATPYCLRCGAPAAALLSPVAGGPGDSPAGAPPGSARFSTTRLRPGYNMEQVDAFLGAIRDTFLGVREPPLTADEIRDKQFTTTRLRPGYDEEEVDAFLNEVEARLRMSCTECGAPAAKATQLCVRCGAPAAGQRSVTPGPVSVAGGDGPGRAASAVTVVSPAGQAAPGSYAPGRGEKVPAPIRRVRRGYSRMGWAAVFGGWALIMVGGYFSELGTPKTGFIYVGLGLLALAATLFGQRIRLSMFLRRHADAGSATVSACQRGGRTLILDAPLYGCPSRLEVRLAWWAEPEVLLPGESVTLYGASGSVGRLLVSNPSQGRAFAGRGRSLASGEVRQDAPYQPGAQQRGLSFLRWGPLVLAGLGFVAAVAATVLVAVPQLTGHLSEGQLRAGDCLTGSNLGLGTGSTWPNIVTAMPCTGPHLAEIYLSGNAWPRSMPYPGDNAVSNEGYGFCLSAFSAYDGIDNSASSFTIDYITPSGGGDWASGDRQLVCMAYQREKAVYYSIKGSGR